MAGQTQEAMLLLFTFLLLFCTASKDLFAKANCKAPDFDVENLISRMWVFSVNGSLCLDRKGGGTVDKCDIAMAFCLPILETGACNNSTVCEHFGDSKNAYSLGSYNPKKNPFNTSALASGVGFTVQPDPGEEYILPNGTCRLRTVVTFYCNASAEWMPSSDPKVPSSVPGSVRRSVQFVPGNGVCLYNISFDFAGACPVRTYSVDHLSPGSIMIMMFIVLVVVYFVLGCFVNIARGKVGEETIPHHRFWAALPVYIMDGILFTLSCGGGGSKQRTYERI